MKYETREVLAGAYRGAGPATLLTHVVAIAGDVETPLCKSVKPESIADGGSLGEAGIHLPATCEFCAARDPRFK